VFLFLVGGGGGAPPPAWVGQIVGWVFLLSKYCEDEGGMAAANAGAGNGLCFGPE
jgi:hypothetical protein